MTSETIQELNDIPDKFIIAVLNEMKELQKYIHRVGKQQLDIPLTITTLDTRETFQIKALLDSGCTGSCIDVEFVKKNNLVMKKLPRPLPVYNADGSLNSRGPISEYIEVFMKVGCHQEKFQLAVSNIGKSEIFIGHDWLKIHNPTIDWQKGTLKFTHCPVDSV